MATAAQADARVALLGLTLNEVVLEFGRRGSTTHHGARPFSHGLRQADAGAPLPTTADDHQRLHNDSWLALDDADLKQLFQRRIPTIQACPFFLRERLRDAFRLSLTELRNAKLRGDRLQETRAWKLFLLTPMLLLHTPKKGAKVPKDELLGRAELFTRRRWPDLLANLQDFPQGVPGGEASR